MAKISKSLLLILILGFGLRLVNLGQSFWLDEASQAVMSSQSVASIWSGRGSDFHPPLYYLLIHFWELFGRSETWLRLPSVLFGVANLYLVYLLANRLLPDLKLKIRNRSFSAGEVSAFLLAINPFHIYYSQEFRSYMLLCFLGTLAVYLLHLRRFWWLAAVNALLFYTHYSSVPLFLTQFLYILLYDKRDLKRFITSGLLFVILILPWMPELVKQMSSGINIDSYLPGWRQVLSLSPLKALPVTLFKLVAGRINFISTIVYLTYIIFVFAVVFLAFRAVKFQRRFLFTLALTPIILMILISFVFPQNQPFRVIYILPVLMIIFAQACLKFPKLFLTLFIYIALVGNLAYFTRPRLQREQWRQAIEFLAGRYSDTASIVVKFSDKFSPFYWYNPQLPVIASVHGYPARSAQVASSLSSLPLNGVKTVFLLDYLGDLTDPNREVDRVIMDLGYTKEKTFNFEGVGFIHLYHRL